MNRITSKERNYFTIVPNIVDDMELSPYEFRLYFHLRRVAGEGGKCYQSTETIAKICRMSVGAVIKAKKKLEALKLIEIEIVITQHGGRPSHHITIVDIWEENVKKFSSSPSEVASSPDDVASSPSGVKEEPIKKIGIKGNKDSNGVKQEEGVKGAKAPRPKLEPDPRGKHPAIVAIRDITNRFPPTGAWDKIIRIIGENPNTAKLKSNYETWCERGYNRNSVIWATEWYVNGAPKSKSALETFATEYR